MLVTPMDRDDVVRDIDRMVNILSRESSWPSLGDAVSKTRGSFGEEMTQLIRIDLHAEDLHPYVFPLFMQALAANNQITLLIALNENLPVDIMYVMNRVTTHVACASIIVVPGMDMEASIYVGIRPEVANSVLDQDALIQACERHRIGMNRERLSLQ